MNRYLSRRLSGEYSLIIFLALEINFFVTDLSLSSPRLGKIRKLPNFPDERPTSGESGFSTEEYSDNSSFFSPRSNSGEVKRLRAKIVLLEQMLLQNEIAVPSDDDLVSFSF